MQDKVKLAIAAQAPQEGAQDKKDEAPETTPLRSIRAIVYDLSKEIAARNLRTRTQGGTTLSYLPWYMAIRYLDHFAPGWSFEIRGVTAIGDRCVVTARVSIPCLEGVVWREATGTEDEELRGYGDPSSNAEAMALKRAAAKFGLGLYLYGGNGRRGENHA